MLGNGKFGTIDRMKPWNPNENGCPQFSPTFAIAGHSVALLLARWPGMQGIQQMTQPTNQPSNQPTNQTKNNNSGNQAVSQLPGSKQTFKKKNRTENRNFNSKAPTSAGWRSMSVLLNFQSLQAPGLARLLWVAFQIGQIGRDQMGDLFWLVVSTYLINISQNGPPPSFLQKEPGKLKITLPETNSKRPWK